MVSREPLSHGADYDINYIQGTISLNKPLSSRVSSGVVDTPGDDYQAYLVVNYEYTPTTGDVDGFSFGGRAEAWVNNRLRVGVTGQVERTGTADQVASGVDLHYRLGERSYAEAEYAVSDGPGFGLRSSNDGGLIFDSEGAVDGDGSAFRFDTYLDLAELGTGYGGGFSAYYENRSAGFSSLDYEVRDDEKLWGFDANVEVSERLEWRA